MITNAVALNPVNVALEEGHTGTVEKRKPCEDRSGAQLVQPPAQGHLEPRDYEQEEHSVPPAAYGVGG